MKFTPRHNVSRDKRVDIKLDEVEQELLGNIFDSYIENQEVFFKSIKDIYPSVTTAEIIGYIVGAKMLKEKILNR
jgi:hypothetical protein